VVAEFSYSIATTAADKPQTANKPAADGGNGLIRAIHHLQYFFGDGLRKELLVRVWLKELGSYRGIFDIFCIIL
jgi:hypothetical protein